MRAYIFATVIALLSLVSAAVLGQGYPTRPVRLIVPFAAGGSTDVLGRMLAQKLTDALGQSVIVDNRAGGGTNIGAEIVARSAPDGYTLLMSSSTQAINASLYPKLAYDLVKDFVAVSPLASSPSVLVAHPSLPVKSVKDVIALAKAKPGELTYASSGSGSTAHLAAELFKMSAGIDLVHIPYKGAGPALTDLLGGHVQLMFGFTAGALPFIKSGRLRPLAVTSERRLNDMPDLPTMREAGIKGYEVSVWYGIMAPAATPKDIVTRLNLETSKAARDLSVRFTELGAYPLQSTPEQFSAFIREEIAKWAVVVKRSKARVD